MNFESGKFSEERARKEAEEMKRMIRAGEASSNDQAFSLLRKNEERSLGKYEEDFGHEEERFIKDFCMELPGIGYSAFSSIYDDQKATGNKIDLIMTFDDGNRIGVQVTGSGDDEKQLAKIKEVSASPFLKELHDDKGDVIPLKKIMPRCIAFMDKAKFGNFYNSFPKGTLTPEKALASKEFLPLFKDMLRSMIMSLQHAKECANKVGKNIDNKAFDGPLSFLQENMKSLEQRTRK